MIDPIFYLKLDKEDSELYLRYDSIVGIEDWGHCRMLMLPSGEHVCVLDTVDEIFEAIIKALAWVADKEN